MLFPSEGRQTLDDWVPATDRAQFFRFEQSLGALEIDPTSRAAASTLFWQLYHGLEGIQDKVAYLDRIDQLLTDHRKPHKNTARQAKAPPLADVAFVDLHLVTILLTAISKYGWGSSEIADNLIDVGRNAFSILPYDDYDGLLVSARRICDVLDSKGINYRAAMAAPPGVQGIAAMSTVDEQRRQSLSAVAAIFFGEAFRRNRLAGNHEMALRDISIAASLWAASDSGLSGELSITEAADSFERLWTTKSSVASWDGVSESCRLIAENLDTESEDLQMDIEIVDAKGFPWREANAYWEHAATVTQGEMNPSEFARVLKQTQDSMHADRLERDFLDDAWAALEDSTRKSLIMMEIAWCDVAKQGGRRLAAINELRLAFESELNSLFSGSLRASIDAILKDERLRKQLGVNAKPSTRSIGLRDMAILLENAGRKDRISALSVQQALAALNLPLEDRSFLFEYLPSYLRKLVDARNQPEHGIERKDLLKNIGQLRREALGIGEPRHFRQLVHIKVQAHRKLGC